MGKSQASRGPEPDPDEPNAKRRAKVRHETKKNDEEVPAGRDWLRKLILALIPVAVGALIPIIFVLIQHRVSPPTPRIEVDGMTVQDASIRNAVSAKIHILLRNTGSQLTIIKQVRLQVDSAEQLPLCVGQGDLSSSASYGATIPARPRPRSVVSVNVHQSEPPDSADHFVVQLHLPKNSHGGISLYQLNVSLVHDNVAKPVEAGYVLLALPLNPNNAFVWTKSSAQDFRNPVEMRTFGDSYPAWSRCLISNSRAVQKFLSLPGARSASLSGLRPALAFCCVLKVPIIKPAVFVAFCPGATPVIRPVSVSVSCDSSAELKHMKWTAWNSHYATGEGTELVNNCRPSCAAGTYYPYSVIVRLSRPVPNGPKESLWTRASFLYPDKGPGGIRTYSADLSPG